MSRFDLLDGIGRARRDVSVRVAEANDLTAREVMAAATALSDVVDTASRGVCELRSALTSFDCGRKEADVASAISAQSQCVAAFVQKGVDDARAQAESATQARAGAAQLVRATQTIEGLAREAKVLALNSRIEAARAGVHGRAFAIVADEMRRLSEAVTATNTMMCELAARVGRVLENLVRQAQAGRARVEGFAEQASVASAQVDRAVSTAHAEIAAALRASDETMSRVLRGSQDALSHLQFQDVVAQGLLRLDTLLHALHVQAARAAGVDADLEPPTHLELGGDKPLAHASAGEVAFF